MAAKEEFKDTFRESAASFEIALKQAITDARGYKYEYNAEDVILTFSHVDIDDSIGDTEKATYVFNVTGKK